MSILEFLRMLKSIVLLEFVMYSHIVNPEKLDLQHMNPQFVEMLNAFGKSIDKKIYVNVGASRSGHSSKSQHYQRPCSTADFYVPGYPIASLAKSLHRFEWQGRKFTGIGLYPYWNNPGAHVDWRTKPVYWYRDGAGVYHYSVNFKEIQDKISDISLSRRQEDSCE